MDHVADENLTLFYEISKQVKFPDFVKKAEIHTYNNNTRTLNPSSYADPYSLIFPCHTKADTYLSYAYFLKTAHQILPGKRIFIQKNLDKFARIWNIEADIKNLKKDLEKAAQVDNIELLPDDKFAIVETWQGQKFKALPLLDSVCIKKAEEHLQKYKNRYPAAWRKRAAEKIVKAAQKFNVEPSNYIKTAASTIPAEIENVIQHILKRAYFINRKYRGTPKQVTLLKIAKVLSCLPKFTEKLAQQTMELLDTFDKELKLHRYYSNDIQTPEEICWKAPVEKKADSDIIRLLTGNAYKLTDLIKAGIAPFRSLGQDFIAAIQSVPGTMDINKVASLVPTLPRPDAEILERALQSFNIKPLEYIKD